MGTLAPNIFGTYKPGNPTKRGGLAGTLSTIGAQNQSFMSGAAGNRATESGATIPGYQSLISSGGYSPLEKANIEQGTTGAIQGAYGTATDQAARRAARTGNTAGYGSFLGGLARSKARDLGANELAVQSKFADEAYQRKLAGLQGLASLYGVDTSFLNSLGNQQLAAAGIGASLAGTRKGGLLGNVISGLI